MAALTVLSCCGSPHVTSMILILIFTSARTRFSFPTHVVSVVSTITVMFRRAPALERPMETRPCVFRVFLPRLLDRQSQKTCTLGAGGCSCPSHSPLSYLRSDASRDPPGEGAEDSIESRSAATGRTGRKVEKGYVCTYMEPRQRRWAGPGRVRATAWGKPCVCGYSVCTSTVYSCFGLYAHTYSYIHPPQPLCDYP